MKKLILSLKIAIVFVLLLFSYLMNKKSKKINIKNSDKQTEDIVYRIFSSTEIFIFAVTSLADEFPRSGYNYNSIKKIILELTVRDINIFFPSFVEVYVGNTEEIEESIKNKLYNFRLGVMPKSYTKLLEIFEEVYWEKYKLIKSNLESSQDINDLVEDKKFKELDEKIKLDKEYYKKSKKGIDKK